MPKRKLVDMYAGPLNVWGPEKEVYSTFGEVAGCTISIGENNVNGTIRIEVRYSSNVATLDWAEYVEGTFIKAQVVHCRVSSTGTGGSVKLIINEN